MRILVIENNLPQRELLADSLRQARFSRSACEESSVFQVTAVADFKKAESLLKEKNFEFVLIDPGTIDEAVSALETVLNKRHIPHAYYTDNEIESLREFVPKPVPVLTKVSDMLRLDLPSRIMDARTARDRWLNRREYRHE